MYHVLCDICFVLFVLSHESYVMSHVPCVVQAEEQGDVQLPMATRPHYASILNEDWDPLDYVGRSGQVILQGRMETYEWSSSKILKTLFLLSC